MLHIIEYNWTFIGVIVTIEENELENHLAIGQ